MSNFKVDKNAKYTKKHEWVRMEEGLAVVGVSDAGQDMLSDVVYIELPTVGDTVTAGAEVAVVESVKAAETVYAPISGTVVEVNDSLVDTPEVVNQRPYSAWFFKLEPTGNLASELAVLLDPTAYDAFVDESDH
ncbi:MAG: glycine cleavage system protein GcvH [Caldilineaceae bacterium]|nr:glycine cleavage system protein GcvH [Caldilineaceae bacterium]